MTNYWPIFNSNRTYCYGPIDGPIPLSLLFFTVFSSWLAFRLPWACALLLALLPFSAVSATLSILAIVGCLSHPAILASFPSWHVSPPSVYGCAVFFQPF